MKYGMIRPFEHKVLIKVNSDYTDQLLSWPPQIEELKKLNNWKDIKKILIN